MTTSNEIKYDIDNLVETFSKHAEEYSKGCIGRPYSDQFNLPLAFKTICEEIIKLKK